MLIKGDYVDSYLYGGWLLVWDGQGRLAVVSTESLAAVTAEVVGVPRAAAQAAFVDNKRLLGTGAGELARLKKSRLVSKATGDVVTLDMRELEPRYYSVAPDASVLDLMVTYYRLYISTDDALLTARLDREDVTDIRKRLPHRCLVTSPHLGSISASCADLGTWLLFNEYRSFGWTDPRTEQVDEFESVRHAWSGSTLLSFDQWNRMDAFRAVVEERDHERALAAVVEQHVDSELLSNFWLRTSLDELGEPAGDVDLQANFVTAFTGMLFAAVGGRLLAVPVANWYEQFQQARSTHDLGPFEGRVLSAADTEAGFVIESDSALTYLAAGHTERLIEREVVSLRSYLRSKRHRRAITATVDGGLLISTLLANHPAPHSARHIFPPG